MSPFGSFLPPVPCHEIDLIEDEGGATETGIFMQSADNNPPFA